MTRERVVAGPAAAAFACALVLAGCGSTEPIPSPSGGGGGGGGGGGSGSQGGGGFDIVGDWLGPYPGPPGSCGLATSEIRYTANGTFTDQYATQKCTTFSVSGTYQLQGTTLNFTQTGTDCGDCGAELNTPESVTIRVVDANSMYINGIGPYVRQGG